MPASNNYMRNHDFLTYSSVFDLTNVVFVCGWEKQHLKVIILPKTCLNEGIRAVLTELHEVLACYPKILNVGDKLPNKRPLKPASPCLTI